MRMPHRTVHRATRIGTLSAAGLLAVGLLAPVATPAAAGPAAAGDRSVPTPALVVADVGSYMASPRPLQVAGRRTLLRVDVAPLRPGARTVVSAHYPGGSTSCTPVLPATGRRSGTAWCWLWNPTRGGRVPVTVSATTWMEGGFAQRRHASRTHVKSVREPRATELSAAAAARARTCDNTSRDVWLTFDDMGSAAQVRGVLAQLRAGRAKGRFFLVGTWTRSHPALVREITAAGHEVHNHSATHARLDRLSDAGLTAELRGGPVETGANAPHRMFRPPYGALWDSTRLARAAAAQGMTVCAWTADTDDWAGASPAQMAARVRDGDRVSPRVEAGGVVLMHVNGRWTSRGGVTAVVGAVRARGLRVAPLS